MTPQDLRPYFTHRINVAEDGCWLWTGTINEKGYGISNLDSKNRGKNRRAHREVWQFVTGATLADTTDLHHTCPNRHCVSPSHLSLLGHTEHAVLTGHERHQGRCKNGHDLTPENSYVRRRADGTFRDRQCRTCRRASRVAEPSQVR